MSRHRRISGRGLRHPDPANIRRGRHGGLTSRRPLALDSDGLLALSCVEARAQGPPDGQLTIAFDASIAPAFLDPAETAGLGTPFVFLYALHDALIKPLPGNDMAPCLAESWSGERRRAHLRLQAARGAPLPQRRPVHRRRREVQLRAIPRRLREAAARPGEVGAGRRPASRALRAAQAVAGLPRLLRHAGHRRGVDRAQEVHREGRRGRIQAAARGARPVPLRPHGPGPGAGPRGQRAVLAEDARRSSASSSRAFPIGRRAWPC